MIINFILTKHYDILVYNNTYIGVVMNSFDALYAKAKDRIRSLSELPSTKEESIEQMLEERGIERRDFMKWVC
jgi:hypothetical protein